MNLDDKSLFLDAMEDVQPLKRATDVHWHPTRNQRAPQRIDTLQLDNFLTTGPNLMMSRHIVPRYRIMAAAGRVTSHYVKRHRQSKKTGSATLSAVVDLETHPRLMPPARGCVHHFSPDTKHHQRV